ncbi:hypothetical protein [Aeromicrobium duanguangcaii]|uniref:Uncharacterized protein n=1 Tax=Aeromicrobium duanguangcaii TaxID=2968086 RepID=A0ABY5KCP7_9ACTN|nr:hypothetical protein [Aeromicrobium duanguangcaii]UUI67548.1 hypothetical protein NP095_10065 [Aeromicrobium duanguangcaii]
MTGPFEMVGNDEAPVCVDGVCAIPEPSAASEPSEPTEDHARG